MPSTATHHVRFRADDLAAANAVVHSVRPSFTLLRLDDETLLHYRHEAYAIPGLRLAHLDIDGSFLGAAEEDESVTVVSVTSGQVRYAYRNGGGDESDLLHLAPSPVLSHHRGPMTAAARDVALEVVAIDRGRLEDTARMLYGDDDFRVEFGSPRPISPPLARFWTKAQGVTWQLVSEGAAEHPLVRASLFRSMAVATLESFQLLGDQEQRFRTVTAQADAYHRAVRFLEDHASLPITVDDAAQAAGVPTRRLLRAFEAHAPERLTPAGYLRRVRLDAARADLVAGRGATVREISLRWGFADPSAFSRSYKATYGETPGATLRG